MRVTLRKPAASSRSGQPRLLFPVLAALLVVSLATLLAWAAATVPTEIEQPGTQPGEFSGFTSPDNCANCHSGTANPDFEPSHGWKGSMMAHASRDPLFWATLAVAEQDFLPDPDPDARGGAGDLCLRCHTPAGWLAGRSTPTDGSGLGNKDTFGVECEFCHLVTDPDQPTSVPATQEIQNPPYEAFDPATGEGYYGSGQYVLNGEGSRLGPYADANANHQFLKSDFVRDADFCGTCHDVSNPAVGDLAHNNGAQVPLEPGMFSGILGSPVDGKAAFNNAPFAYGMVERTSSEWKASAYPSWSVNDFSLLPEELQVAGGALQVAYERAWTARSTADYEDGDTRTYTCQTCHLSASTGVGCNKSGVRTRTDLPRHDMTGGGHWVPDLIKYQDDNGLLRFGGGLDAATRAAMEDGRLRAEAQLRSAASLEASQVGGEVHVRVTNLTGHKLISGYPEGRRMWLNLRWLDAVGEVVAEEGAYGPIGRTVEDLAGVPHEVRSLLDLHGTVLYEAKPGMDQAWAQQLLDLGYSAELVLQYDRLTDQPVLTLGDLSADPSGSHAKTFHFVLNNVMTSDTRIPPYGFRYDEARRRNALPVPQTQFGDPGPGGTYEHAHAVARGIPAGAVTVEVRLFYQQTTWEYVQFLWLANDRLNAFLGDEGVNLLDGWANTSMAEPFEMSSTTLPLSPTVGAPGEASDPVVVEDLMTASYDAATDRIDVLYTPACDASNHSIYYGDLALVSTYSYLGAACDVGATGQASFDPGLANAFFLVVGHDGAVEGPYGLDSDSTARPEDLGTPVCDRAQDLGSTCDPQ